MCSEAEITHRAACVCVSHASGLSRLRDFSQARQYRAQPALHAQNGITRPKPNLGAQQQKGN